MGACLAFPSPLVSFSSCSVQKITVVMGAEAEEAPEG